MGRAVLGHLAAVFLVLLAEGEVPGVTLGRVVGAEVEVPSIEIDSGLA